MAEKEKKKSGNGKKKGAKKKDDASKEKEKALTEKEKLLKSMEKDLKTREKDLAKKSQELKTKKEPQSPDLSKPVRNLMILIQRGIQPPKPLPELMKQGWLKGFEAISKSQEFKNLQASL